MHFPWIYLYFFWIYLYFPWIYLFLNVFPLNLPVFKCISLELSVFPLNLPVLPLNLSCNYLVLPYIAHAGPKFTFTLHIALSDRRHFRIWTQRYLKPFRFDQSDDRRWKDKRPNNIFFSGWSNNRLPSFCLLHCLPCPLSQCCQCWPIQPICCRLCRHCK